jgi:hypothetical protein
MYPSNIFIHLFNYLDDKTVEQLSNTSKLATNVSRIVRRIPGVADKWIKIEDVDILINRFPGVIHINIKCYDERINDYIYLFRQNLIKIYLTYTGVTNVSALGGVHTLDLSGCLGVTDVSALGGVHTLDLSDCVGVTDVSALGGVHTLDLSGCTGVTDVSALGGVHTLDLSCCKGVTDVSALGGVHTLNLYKCTGVTDVSMLTNVKIIR